MAALCNNSGCHSEGTRFCGACGDVRYCSAECQKEDWKVHKRLCVNMNMLPLALLPLSQVQKYHEKSFDQVGVLRSQNRTHDAINLFQRLLSFTEHQCGVPIEGTPRYRRSNGVEIDNALLIFYRITMNEFYDEVQDFDALLPSALAARDMLESQDKSKDRTVRWLCQTESHLASAYDDKGKDSEAEHHCEQSRTFAKLIKGEGGAGMEYRALQRFANIRMRQGRHHEAVDLAEQAYIVASDAHGPIHYLVQDSVVELIQYLINIKDFSKAENYSRVNYSNLIDPLYGVDQESELVADGMRQLAQIWISKDAVDDEEAELALAEEAEQLIRKACSITDKLYSHDPMRRTPFEVTFGLVLMQRGKYTDETRIVLEQSLALSRQGSGQYLTNIIHALDCLDKFHDDVSTLMPPGDARDRELKRRDEYRREKAEKELERSYGR